MPASSAKPPTSAKKIQETSCGCSVRSTAGEPANAGSTMTTSSKISATTIPTTVNK